MKFKKVFYWLGLALVCFLISHNQGYAQQWYGAATYQVSFPMGDTKEYTNNTSFRGVGLDFRYKIKKAMTVGITLGWNVFYERTDETMIVETDNPGAITGTQDRYLNSFPIMASFHYYFGQKRGIRPYLGLNAGVYRMIQRLGIGIRAIQNNRWEWGVAPEVGIIFPVDRELAILVNGKYNYTFTGESVVGTDINHSYVTIGLGLVWRQ